LIFDVIPTVVLLCSAILQFISTTLIVTVLNNNRRPPSKNTFTFTLKQAENFYNYEMFYIYTYLMILLVTVIILMRPTDGKDINVFYFLSFLAAAGLASLAVFMFRYAFNIYDDIINKKKPLYTDPNVNVNNNITLPPQGGSNITVTTRPNTPSIRPYTKPIATTPVPTQDLCY